jgi:hypothetical protein
MLGVLVSKNGVKQKEYSAVELHIDTCLQKVSLSTKDLQQFLRTALIYFSERKDVFVQLIPL